MARVDHARDEGTIREAPKGYLFKFATSSNKVSVTVIVRDDA